MTWEVDLASGTVRQVPDDVEAVWNQDNPRLGWVEPGELHEILFDC